MSLRMGWTTLGLLKALPLFPSSGTLSLQRINWMLDGPWFLYIKFGVLLIKFDLNLHKPVVALFGFLCSLFVFETLSYLTVTVFCRWFASSFNWSKQAGRCCGRSHGTCSRDLHNKVKIILAWRHILVGLYAGSHLWKLKSLFSALNMSLNFKEFEFIMLVVLRWEFVGPWIDMVLNSWSVMCRCQFTSLWALVMFGYVVTQLVWKYQ